MMTLNELQQLVSTLFLGNARWGITEFCLHGKSFHLKLPNRGGNVYAHIRSQTSFSKFSDYWRQYSLFEGASVRYSHIPVLLYGWKCGSSQLKIPITWIHLTATAGKPFTVFGRGDTSTMVRWAVNCSELPTARWKGHNAVPSPLSCSRIATAYWVFAPSRTVFGWRMTYGRCLEKLTKYISCAASYRLTG